MKSIKVRILFVLLLCLCGFMVWADELAIKPDFGVSGLGVISSWNAELYGGIRGLQLVPGVESKVLAHLGGGYFGNAWYNDAQLKPLVDADFKFPGAAFNYWQINGKLGTNLGWAYSETLEKNWLYSLVYLKTKRQWNIEHKKTPSTIMAAAVPESQGLWESSLFANLVVDLTSRDKFLRTKQGFGAEVSVDWAPGIELNRLAGQADYYRLNGTLRYYQPLVNTSTVSAYIGNRFTADYLGGSRVPLWAQGTVGGLFEGAAPGGRVRGIAGKRYDANVKLINNLEAHLMFPTLISYAIVPDLFAFFDCALTDTKDHVLKPLDQSLYTVGGGLFLDFGFGLPGVFDYTMVDVGYFISYSISEERWNFFNLVFSLHF